MAGHGGQVVKEHGAATGVCRSIALRRHGHPDEFSRLVGPEGRSARTAAETVQPRGLQEELEGDAGRVGRTGHPWTHDALGLGPATPERGVVGTGRGGVPARRGPSHGRPAGGPPTRPSDGHLLLGAAEGPAPETVHARGLHPETRPAETQGALLEVAVRLPQEGGQVAHFWPLAGRREQT